MSTSRSCPKWSNKHCPEELLTWFRAHSNNKLYTNSTTHLCETRSEAIGSNLSCRVGMGAHSFILLVTAFTLSVATHYRFGNVAWRPTGGRGVTFDISLGWRRSFGWSPRYPNVGNSIRCGTWYLGDGKSLSINALKVGNMVHAAAVADASRSHRKTTPKTGLSAPNPFNIHTRLSIMEIDRLWPISRVAIESAR